jgi:NitT/TauT family transport system permease protein
MRKSLSLSGARYDSASSQANRGAAQAVAAPPGAERPTSIRRQRRPLTVVWSGLLLLAIWQIAVVTLEYPRWLLPGPLDVLGRLRQTLADGTLLQHALPTLIESVGGFGLALVVGALLGYLVAHSPLLERVITPYFTALQAIPVIAVAPLVIIWLGDLSDIARNTLVAAIVVVFPVFSSTIAGIRGIQRDLREMALVSGANRWQMLRYVELPLALPVLFSGIRTSLAFATTGAVIGEFLGARYGLGALINVARGLFDTALIFVALLCLGLITLLFYLLLRGAERLLLPWYDEMQHN